MIVPTITVKHNKFRRDQQNKKYITYGNRIMIRRDTDLIEKKEKKHGYQKSQEGRQQHKDRNESEGNRVAQKKGRAILNLEIQWKGKDGQERWQSH